MGPTRTITPHQHRRLCLLVVLTMGLAGVASGLWWRGAIILPGLITAFLLTFLLAKRCQHVEWVAVFGAVMGFMVFAVPCAIQAVFWGGAGALVSSRFLGAVIPLTLVSTCLGMALAVAWRSACRLLVLRLVEEKVCSNCGYCIEHLPSDTCPECGKIFDISATQTDAPVNILGRRFRKLCVVTGLLMGLSGGLLLLRNSATWPYAFLPSFWEQSGCHSPSNRGWAFYVLISELAGASRYRGETITSCMMRSVVGPPDLYYTDGKLTVYVYFYDEGKSVAYADFQDDRLTSVGYNAAHVNDHSAYQAWPDASE